MYDRIYFVGYMGAGKTTQSRKLARMLNWDWVDLDEVFEERYKISIANFFKKYDESLFRKLESQLLKETNRLQHTVIATGGGLPCYYDNMAWMLQHGLTIYLRISADAAMSRLLSSKKKRPVIQNKSPEELKDFIKSHMRQRNIYYTQAQLVVKAESFEVQELLQKVKPYLQ